MLHNTLHEYLCIYHKVHKITYSQKSIFKNINLATRPHHKRRHPLGHKIVAVTPLRRSAFLNCVRMWRILVLGVA